MWRLSRTSRQLVRRIQRRARTRARRRAPPSSLRLIDLGELADELVEFGDAAARLDDGEEPRLLDAQPRVQDRLLRHLELPLRRPYQTRHTAATLWLAAGENPEWIARQMGHTTTEMLFRVYSRYVPNLTRQDGSAFEAVLRRTLNDIQDDDIHGGNL